MTGHTMDETDGQQQRLREAMHNIAAAARHRQLAIFCGAGISRNSGIPLAKDQKEYVLEKLPFMRSQLFGIDKRALYQTVQEVSRTSLEQFFANPEEPRLVFKADFPLTMEKHCPDSEMRAQWWRLFQSTVYGKTVYALPFEAFWESLGGIHPIERTFRIYTKGEPNTTHAFLAKLAKRNYLQSIVTTNFDLLLEKALRDEHVDFAVFADEAQFQQIPNGADRVRLIKIHGSAHDFESIRTTITQLAKRELSEARADVIRQ